MIFIRLISKFSDNIQSRDTAPLARKTISRHDRDCLSSFDARIDKEERIDTAAHHVVHTRETMHRYPRIQALLRAKHDYSDDGSLSTNARIDNIARK